MAAPNPMTARSGKNFALSPAAADLGLGDLVTQQLQADLDNRKKAKQQSGFGDILSPAALSIFGRTGF